MILFFFVSQAIELEDNKTTNDFTIQNVTVVVLDVNDQPPIFNQEQYTITVPENLGIIVLLVMD